MNTYRKRPAVYRADVWQWHIVLLMVLTSLSQVLAQDLCDKAQRPTNSVEGGFTVNVTRGCAPLTVRVANTKTAATSVSYFYEYAANANISTGGSTQTSYTYTKPGRYKILQTGSLSGTGMLFCQDIEVLATPLVDFTPRSCSDRLVVADITLTDDSRKYDKIRISWGDGTPFQDMTIDQVIAQPRQTHTYTANGNFSVTILGLYNGINCGGSSTKQVTIGAITNNNNSAITALTVRDDKTILLQYQVTGSGPVELHQKNAAGDFTPTGKTATAASGTFTITTDAKKVQCFRIVTKDVCGNAASSEDMCSIVADAQAESKQNKVSWTAYAGSSTFLRYRIFRNGATNPLTNIAERATGVYVDASNIDCNVQYCYTVAAEVTNSVGGRTIITAAPVCVTGVGAGDAPGNIRSVLVSVEDNYPRLVVTSPAVGATTQYALSIERSDGPNGSFQPLSTIQNTNVFRDETARPNERSYCYRVTYQNNCGMKSTPAPPVCTVWLTSKTATAIDWTADAPFFPQDVAFYTVEFIDSLGRQAREHMNVGGNTHFEPDLDDPRLQAVRFRIIANAGNGTVSYSNFFELRQNAKIFAPDVFTPNGDGQNDEFTVIGKYWKKFTMTIFNRWGEALYQTTEMGKGWDGLINGQPAESGTYIYRVEIDDNTGVRSVRRGSFLLMR